jgi:deoxyribodipyrimidine photo-lyase
MATTAIVWFRNDLRLHDNEALTLAVSKFDFVLPVYVFDERIFTGKTSLGFQKTAKFRTKFLIEAVADLRQNLREKGSDLLIFTGKPEEILFSLAESINSQCVICNRERTHEEVFVQDALEKKLWQIGQELNYVRGKMLYHTADLPFPVSQLPDVFTQFRKEIEATTPIREPLDEPVTIPFPESITNRGELPTLATFDKEDVASSHLENLHFIGGETHALNQLSYYFWDKKLVTNYKETRNGLHGWDYSSKFSPWLAAGCISPRKIFYELQRYEEEHGKNESTYWLYFELLWRDYFRLVAKKHGNRIFQLQGIKGKLPETTCDWELFTRWQTGNTGVPFVDACMRQLAETGFMSNRGRQNVASFLVHDLGVDWLLGAEYFESMLLDYDPCSNYGNWNYIAGVGNDPREQRQFNIATQASKYDAKGEFVKFWQTKKALHT